MADVDPKEIILKNKALVVVYVLTLVPIVVWFAALSDVKSGKRDSFKSEFNKLRRSAGQINDLDGRIQNPNPEDPDGVVFTQGHVDGFKKQKELLTKQQDDLRKLVAGRGNALRRWFEKWKDLKWDADPPEHTEFAEHWKEVAIPELTKTFEAIIDPDGPDGPLEPHIDTTVPSPNQRRRYQKRYWILKAVLTALKQGGKTLTPKLQGIPSFVDGGKVGGSTEEGKAKPLYTTSTVQVELICSFRDLPVMVREILAQDIPMQVVGIDVSKASFRFDKPWKRNTNEAPLVDGSGKVFEDFYYTAELAKKEDFKRDLEKYIPEPAIKVSLKVEVLDFEVKAEEKKAATPPAGEQEQ